MSRASIVIQPSDSGSIDFKRREWDASQIWLEYPKAAWLPTLLPAAISEANSGSNFFFSTFRRFPSCNPADFAFSNETNVLTRLYLPLGGRWDPSMYVCLFYYDPRRAPVLGQDRFHITGNGLKRLLSETLEAPAFIDSMRKLSGRPKIECWVRHDLHAVDLAPDAIKVPRWMEQTEGQTPEQAAQTMAGLRAPTSTADWLKAREADRRKRDAKELAKLAPAEPETPVEPDPPTSPTPPTVLTLEQRRELRKTREKLAKATRQKVAADALDKVNAEKHAQKVVARLEREGRL